MVMVAFCVAAVKLPEAACDAWTVAVPALAIVIVVPDILITEAPAITEYVNAPELFELGWVIVNADSPNVLVMSKLPKDGATAIAPDDARTR
jgi:hypothetical protein